MMSKWDCGRQEVPDDDFSKAAHFKRSRKFWYLTSHAQYRDSVSRYSGLGLDDNKCITCFDLTS